MTPAKILQKLFARRDAHAILAFLRARLVCAEAAEDTCIRQLNRKRFVEEPGSRFAEVAADSRVAFVTPVSHPSEVVEIGQEIAVQVLDIDLDRRRISLALKQTTFGAVNAELSGERVGRHRRAPA